MNSIGEKLKAYWLSIGLALPPGNGRDQIREFEIKYGVDLPSDMRDYFLQVDGMSIYWPNAQDKEGYSFWPLSKLKTVPEEARKHSSQECFDFPEAESFFIFADYLDWSWAYAIRLSDDQSQQASIFIIGKAETPIYVAGSFSDFVELYLTDSPLLYGVSAAT